ncbi:Esterase EstD (plasmid) [Asticcacaulis sp. MM231]|uniref:alpha/beta hydrolase family protein n=1 Tax=Asticcacaulis sp. MM231 TaxID=3157666 RepID=UPI0032D57BF2
MKKQRIKVHVYGLSLFMAVTMACFLPAQGSAGEASPRPQEAAIAKASKPYPAEEVRFSNAAAGVTLAGSFSTPEGKGPFPTVILLAGSGPNDRDEVAQGPQEIDTGHKKFLVLADAINRCGIAVLRYDKRGVGRSTGDFASASLSDLASDAQAAIRYLATRKDVDQHRIGLIGDSEGGYIAPMIVTREPSLRFMALLSTAALPFDQVNLIQKAAISRAEGKGEADIASDEALYRQIFSVVLAAHSPEEARATLTAMSKPLIVSGRFSQAEADVGIAGLTSPLGFEMMRYDPQPYLSQINIPVLVLSGSLDTQAPPKENLPAMRSALRANQDVTILELPGLNHQLQSARTGAPSEYALIDETLATSAIKAIGDWLLVYTQKNKTAAKPAP